MCSVFVTHRTRDIPTAERLVAVLRAAMQLDDQEVLFTGQVTTSMAPGEDVATRIRRELDDCRVVVGLVTDATYDSAYQMMELGGAWLRDRLIVTVTSARDLANLPAPLNEEQSVRLDDANHVVRLVQQVGALIGKPVQPPASYETQLKGLLSRTRGADRLWRTLRTARRITAAAFLLFLISSYMLARQNVLGQIYVAGERRPLSGATVYVGTDRSGVATDAHGWFSFTVWSAFPTRHRLNLKVDGEETRFPARWTGPWPLQLLFNDSFEFQYDPDKSKPLEERFTLSQRSSPFVATLYALASPFSRAAAPREATYAQPARQDGVGFLVEVVDTPQSSLAFLSPKRAYFKVYVGGRELQEREILGPPPDGGANYFPVQSNMRSWIPVTQDTTTFGSLFCRLPGGIVAVDGNNRATFGQNVAIHMISDRGREMSRHMLDAGRAFPLGQRVRLRDENGKGSGIVLHVRLVAAGR